MKQCNVFPHEIALLMSLFRQFIILKMSINLFADVFVKLCVE